MNAKTVYEGAGFNFAILAYFARKQFLCNNSRTIIEEIKIKHILGYAQ